MFCVVWRALLMRAEDRLGYNKPLNCKLCIGGMTQAELVLNYVADYVNGYHRLSTSTAADDAYGSDGGRRNTFGLAWVNSLTHDFLNWPKIADGYFANFLRNISQSGALDKTILFFVSDHGLRQALRFRLTIWTYQICESYVAFPDCLFWRSVRLGNMPYIQTDFIFEVWLKLLQFWFIWALSSKYGRMGAKIRVHC